MRRGHCALPAASKTLCPAPPSLQRVPWVSVPRLLGFSRFQPSVLCSAKTTVSPSRVASPQARFPIPCVLRLRSCPLSGSLPGCEDDPNSAWPCSFPGVPHRFSPQGDDGPLKFPGYPYMHMPRSSIPVVSSLLALALQGLQPSGVSKPSAFPDLRPVIPMDHNHYLFGTRSRGLHTRYTWLHTHPCGICTQVRYRFGGYPPLMGIGPQPAPTG